MPSKMPPQTIVRRKPKLSPEQNKIGVGSALSVVYIFNVLIVLGLVLLLTRKVVSNNAR